MGKFLVQETILFFYACILGAFLGLIFDLFRIFRMAVKCGTVWVFIQDILYFSIITFVTFIFLLSYNDGRFRMFILVGELMGSVLYFFSVSIIILKSSKLIINTTKRVFAVLLKPFNKIYDKVYTKISNVKGKTHKKIPKIKIFDKFSLKSVRNIVYNKFKFKKNDLT